jgi:hypothetical protein
MSGDVHACVRELAVSTMSVRVVVWGGRERGNGGVWRRRAPPAPSELA